MKAMAGSVVYREIGAGNVTNWQIRSLYAEYCRDKSEALTRATKAGVNPTVYQAPAVGWRAVLRWMPKRRW